MIQDSGNRKEFESGAVRDMQEGKGRCDLLPLDIIADLFFEHRKIFLNLAGFIRNQEEAFIYKVIGKFAVLQNISYARMMLEVAVHYEQGAEKYSDRNWEKGIPLSNYISSGVRHLLKHIDKQTDERHDRAFVWNMLGLLWTLKHRPEMNDLPGAIKPLGGIPPTSMPMDELLRKTQEWVNTGGVIETKEGDIS